MRIEDAEGGFENTSEDFADTASQLPPNAAGPSSAENSSGEIVVAQLSDDPTPVDAAESETTTDAALDGVPTTVVAANDQNQVQLPAGTSIEDVLISDAELVLMQPDGSAIIIRGAALNVPTFVIGDVEIPQEALVAAFADSGIDIAAGPDGTLIATQTPEGAGGDFLVEAGDIGDAGPLIDLLGGTELTFPDLEERELFTDELEDDSAVSSPFSVVATSILATDQVAREAGIDQTATQSPGSDEIADGNGFNDSSNQEVSGIGQISVNAPAGISEILINGVLVDLTAPQTVITGTNGFLTVTPVNVAAGEFQYFYTATTALDHPLSQDILTETFTVEVIDGSGANLTTTFQVGVLDDVPSVSITADTDVALSVDEGDQDQGNPSTGVASVINTGAIAKGDDPDVSNAGGVAITSAVTAAPLVSATPIFGADGEADTNATQFAFSITSNGSGLTVTDGSPIVLVDVNGDGTVIVGQVQGGAFDGDAAFALQIDPATGLVTIEQYLSLAHPDQHDGTATGQSYDEAISLGESDLQIVVTVTDGDGDQAQAFVAVGSKILFEDDGPIAAINNQTDTVFAVVDESADVFTGTPGSGLDGVGSATIALANSFAAAAYGADGAGSTSYSFVLSSNGLGSGLYATDPSATDGQGAEILLRQEADGSITGYVGDTTYFTISVDAATGEATFTLTGNAPIWHAFEGAIPDGGVHEGSAHDDVSSMNIGTGGTLEIVQTVIDGDGDRATASINLSNNVFQVEDDGPVATDEALQSVAEGETLSGSFDFSAGADGGSLTAINGSPVTFNTDGWSDWIDLGFGDIRVMADGAYEFRADPALGDAVPPVNGTYTITDGDLDTATADFSFQITDAGTPTNGSASAAVDDDGLSGGNPASTVGDLDADASDASAGLGDESLFVGTLGGSVGSDGAGTNGFTWDTSQNGTTGTLGLENVTYTVTATTVTATVSPGEARAGTVLYTATITDPATGAYEVQLLDNVLHVGGPNDEATDATDSLTYIITDADGSSVGGNTLTITFDDDAPSAEINIKADLDVAVVDESSSVFTGTPGSGTDGVASVTIGLADNFATPVYGADGAGSTVYELVLSAQNIGSGLYATDATQSNGQGAEILLSQSGNVITGSAGGDTYFTITVNPATGEVTFALQSDEPIWHSDTGNHDDASVLTIDPQDGTLVIRQTVTDADGDTAQASIDLSGNTFKVEDDGPKAEADALAELEMVVLDESSPVFTGTPGSGTDGIQSVTVGLANKFVAPVYGADGAGTTTYSLVLSAQNIGSGLYATDATQANGQGGEILLSQSGNVITGSEGGTTYFTITIDPGTGEVTFALANDAPIWHANTGNHDDVSVLSIDPQDGTLVIRQTVTDADGDSAQANIDLSNNIFKVEDDGPTAGSVSVTSDTAYLDESVGTDGSQQDETNNALPNDEAGVTDPFDAKNFGTMIGYATLAAALTVTASGNAGADGPGSETVDLTDGSGDAHDGTATSLSLSSTGQTIYLFTDDDGVLVGRAGDNAVDAETGTVAFAIGIDGTSVEIAQYNALTHSNTSSHDEAVGLDQLVYVSITTKDGDGDSAVATSGDALNISFEDDGPEAVNDAATLLQGQTDFNIAFVLDFSSSISDAELDTMLDAVEQAGKSFFEANGDVIIHLVPFASTAISAGPFTDFTSFLSQLEAWNPADGGVRPLVRGTDYTAGIEETMDVYTPLSDYENQVFFLSDGNPNQQLGTGGHSLADATRSDWNDFVTDNDISVQTIGIGNNLQEARLQDLDEVDGDNSVISVANFDDLVDALTDLANVETISGNVLLGTDGVAGGGDDDSFGSDGGRILSINVGTVLYTYDVAQDEITNNGGEPDQAGSVLTVKTPADGTLEFNFITGAWTFSSSETTNTGVETFEYTLIDNDGDTSAATLTVDIVLAPSAVRDIVLTNITDFSPIDIPNEALLNNDIEVGNPLSVTSVSNPGNGTVAPGAQFDPSVQLVTKVYDFLGVTRATNDHFAYEFEIDPSGSYSGLADLTAEVGIGGPGSPSADEATDTEYEQIARVGNGEWQLPDPGSGNDDDHGVFWAQFSIDETASSITEISVTIDARSTASNSDLGVWNHTTSQWVQLDGLGDVNEWSGSITTDIADYLDPSTNQLTVAFVNALDDDPFKVDYIRVEVTAFETTFSNGSFDYDVSDGNGFTDTASVGVKGVDSATVTGNDEDEILIGNDSGSTLDGAGGNDYIIGGDSVDTLIGGEGEDVLAGGLGADLLWGGNSGGTGDLETDTFVIDDATAVDIIGDFEAGVDEIDLTALINGLSPSEDPEADGYVQVIQNGGDAEVQVDTDGGGDNFQTVVTLQNFTVTDETVRILYNDTSGDTSTDV